MKLNWRKQNALCVLLVIVGHILTDTLDNWVWRNTAFVICGLMYIFHPVLPSNVAPTKQTLRWARIAGVILILIGIFTRVQPM